MARPELRAELRRIDDVPQRRHRGLGVVLGGRDHRRRRVDRPVVGLPDRLRPHGADVRAVRHPHARGGPQAALHQQAGQRLGGDLAGRLPDLDADRPLPSRALRPPQGGVRTERARHRLLRRLPVRPPGAGPAAGARRGGHLGVEELRPAVPVAQVPRLPAHVALDPRRPGCCCGRCCGPPPGGGGSTRCCGGCRG